MARLTKYTKDFVTKADSYIEACGALNEVKTRPKIESGIVTGEEQYASKRIKLPTIEGLALELDINRDTIYEWSKEHSEFSDIIEKLRKKQADMLINYGLSGDYNPTISKVLLTKHGYIEKQETDVTSKGEQVGVIMLPQKNENTLESTTETSHSPSED